MKTLALPSLWMPDAIVKRIVGHWTAGGYFASETDKDAYHFLIEGDGDVVRGEFPVTAQHPPLVEGHYAAHTRGTNSYAIGVSLCCMANANESPFNPGRAPMRPIQWIRMAEVIATLCTRYGVPVTPSTVLTHAEVQKTLKHAQRGKWDISRLPFDSSIKNATQAGDALRAAVRKIML